MHLYISYMLFQGLRKRKGAFWKPPIPKEEKSGFFRAFGFCKEAVEGDFWTKFRSFLQYRMCSELDTLTGIYIICNTVVNLFDT